MSSDILEWNRRLMDELHHLKELGLFTALCPYCNELVTEFDIHIYHKHPLIVHIMNS